MTAWGVIRIFTADIQQCAAERGVEHWAVPLPRKVPKGGIDTFIFQYGESGMNFRQHPGSMRFLVIAWRR